MTSIINDPIPKLPEKIESKHRYLVSKMLEKDPCKRPSISELMIDITIANTVSGLLDFSNTNRE